MMVADALPYDGIVRKMWGVENSRYRDHLLRLDEETRRGRFGDAVSDAFLLDYAERKRSRDTVIHGFFVNGTMRGAGELRPIESPADAAEAAFSIERSWQSHGVGSALLARTLLAARNRGIKFLHIACLADNERMQQLARKFDAELHFDFGSIAGEVKALRAMPLSLMLEIVSDGHGFVTAMFDVQSRLLHMA